MSSVFEINYQFPKEELKAYFEKHYPKMVEWAVPNYFSELNDILETKISGFKVAEFLHNDRYLREVGDTFLSYYGLKLQYITQFLVVEPNAILPWHEDGIPAYSCINCLLSNHNVPVEFEDGVYSYNTALLNIRNKHRIINNNEIRVMFRMVFYEEHATFSTVKSLLNAKSS